MSINSLCDRFDATLKTQVSSKTASGGASFTWTTDARGGDPTSVRCDMQTMTAEEKSELGITESKTVWAMYTATDPKLRTKDLVEWTDNSSIERSCQVLNPSYDMAGRNRIWKTVLVEYKARL